MGATASKCFTWVPTTRIPISTPRTLAQNLDALSGPVCPRHRTLCYPQHAINLDQGNHTRTVPFTTAFARKQVSVYLFQIVEIYNLGSSSSSKCRECVCHSCVFFSLAIVCRADRRGVEARQGKEQRDTFPLCPCDDLGFEKDRVNSKPKKDESPRKGYSLFRDASRQHSST